MPDPTGENGRGAASPRSRSLSIAALWGGLFVLGAMIATPRVLDRVDRARDWSRVRAFASPVLDQRAWSRRKQTVLGGERDRAAGPDGRDGRDGRDPELLLALGRVSGAPLPIRPRVLLVAPLGAGPDDDADAGRWAALVLSDYSLDRTRETPSLMLLTFDASVRPLGRATLAQTRPFDYGVERVVAHAVEHDGHVVIALSVREPLPGTFTDTVDPASFHQLLAVGADATVETVAFEAHSALAEHAFRDRRE